MIYRALKMRSNADGSGNGDIYEKGDLIETESIIAAEKRRIFRIDWIRQKQIKQC